MNWENASSSLEIGSVRIAVSPANAEKQWQFFILDFGTHSNASHEECLKTWPREAIARARKELDKLEHFLNEEETDG